MRKYFDIIKKLWITLKPFHKHFYLQLFYFLLLQIISILAVTFTSKIITELTNKDFSKAYYFLLAFLIAGVFSQLIHLIVDKLYLKHLEYEVQQYLQQFSLKKVLSMNILQLTEDHSQYKLSVITKGEQATETIINILLLSTLPTLSFAMFSIAYLFFISSNIAVWDVLVCIILVVWISKFNKDQLPSRKKNNDEWDIQAKARGEIFQHLTLIKYFGKEINSITKYVKDRKEKIEYGVWVWSQNINHYVKKGSFMSFAESVSIGMAIYLFYTGKISIGVIYLVFTLSSRVFNQINSLTGQMRQLPMRFIEVEKYLNAIETEPLFRENYKTKFSAGDIVFDNVSFKYPKGEINTFENLSLVIEKGKKVAFVGHSGSGKSTIIKLLLRAYEYDGSIKINGKELKEIDSTSLRNHIGYVEQHVDLFDTTIQENILFGVDEKEKKKAKKKLEEIAGLARIDEFYHRLGEKKFETVIGEKGIKLSGGERQRVGIARAIIKNPEILIFDEATSSLDTENEKYVVEAINNVSKGKTTIVIAHRLSTIMNADKIFVMSRGGIVGVGTHDELMNNCSEYKSLMEAQVES